jgi:S-methylmethionine-dependent homocysteine/selenocysteine methylase
MTASFKSQPDGFPAVAQSDPNSAYLEVLSAHSSILSCFLYSSAETGGWPVVILDGAGGTELERRQGPQLLSSPLWSARCVATDAGRMQVRQLHRDYLDAGADIITAISYQASVEEFQRVLMVDRAEALRLMRLTVELAVEARDDWWRDDSHHKHRQRPLVAASIGCYGACMAGGQEYTGDYELTTQHDVEQFQRHRIQVRRMQRKRNKPPLPHLTGHRADTMRCVSLRPGRVRCVGCGFIAVGDDAEHG